MVVAAEPEARRVRTTGAGRVARTGSSDEQRTSYLEGCNATPSTVSSNKIEPPPRQTINFTARDGVVSLTFKLSTGYPVTMDLFLQGEKLEFPGPRGRTHPADA